MIFVYLDFYCFQQHKKVVYSQGIFGNSDLLVLIETSFIQILPLYSGISYGTLTILHFLPYHLSKNYMGLLTVFKPYNGNFVCSAV